MKMTVEIAEKRFAHFNRLIFKGKLPPVPIALSRGRTRVGSCHFIENRTWGSVKRSDFSLRFSTAFDLKPHEWDDVIIHEMIHYYIGVNALRDTSSHGKLFKQLMNGINAKFGRNVTITHSTKTDGSPVYGDNSGSSSLPAVKHRYRMVAVMTFKDGKKGFKVLPRVYNTIVKYVSAAKNDPKVASVELYQAPNDFFGHYPSSGALRVYSFEEGTYEKVMEGAVCMAIENNVIHAVKK